MVAGKIGNTAIPLFGRFWFFCGDSGGIADWTVTSIRQTRVARQYSFAPA
jgi:hypothetical protein